MPRRTQGLHWMPERMSRWRWGFFQAPSSSGSVGPQRVALGTPWAMAALARPVSEPMKRSHSEIRAKVSNRPQRPTKEGISRPAAALTAAALGMSSGPPTKTQETLASSMRRRQSRPSAAGGRILK